MISVTRVIKQLITRKRPPALLTLSPAPEVHDTRRLADTRMSSTINPGTGSSHLDRTSDKPRDPDIHEVTVSKIVNLSPTVKKLVLSIAATAEGDNPKLAFKAGQWVDLFVPGIPKIGGFTITSSPYQLQEAGSLDLAIQYSEAQPAFWVHEQCQVGDIVSIRIGGDFFFDVQQEGDQTIGLLLLAGGVGINPLMSIIHSVHGSTKLPHPQISTVLLYSAKSQQELIFQDEFETLAAKTHFRYKFFLTGEYPVHDAHTTCTNGRIRYSDVKDARDHLLAQHGGEVTLDGIKVYICGPPPMIQAMEEMTELLNLKNIAYEKWW